MFGLDRKEVARLTNRNQYHRDTLENIRVNNAISWGQIHKEVIDLGNSMEQDKVRLLDAGAGEGRYREILSDINNLEYIGVDSAVGSDDWDYSKVIKSDLGKMDFIENESVDIAISIQVLSHVKQLGESVKGVAEKIKPGGTMIVTTQNMQSLTHIPYDFRRLTPYGLESVFSENGLVLTKIQPLLYGDNESAARQLEYAMKQNLLNNDGSSVVTKFVSYTFLFGLRVFRRILRRMDSERGMPFNPIGYYAVFKKA